MDTVTLVLAKKQSGIVMQNLIKNGNFAIDSDGDGLADGFVKNTGVTSTRIEDGIQYWTGTSNSYDGALRYILDGKLDLTHQYYLRLELQSISGILFYTQTIMSYPVDGSCSTIFTPIQNQVNYFQFRIRNVSVESAIQNLVCIDLTQVFGIGNEPTKDEMDALLAYFPNSWFDGQVNANREVLGYVLDQIRELKLALITTGGTP